MTQRAAEALLPWALGAAVVVLWWPALGASFQFDDWNVIVRDPRVQSFAAWWASMPGMRALLKLSYALGHELGGTPAAFRAFNIALHALNAVLVLRILRLVGRGDDGPGMSIAAAIGALVFALHPVQTESVTYVSGRSGALAGAFALLSVLLASDERVGGDGARRARCVASLLSFALALLAKETAAAVPLAIVLVRVAMREPAQTPGAALRAGLHRASPHLLLLAFALAAAALLAAYRFVASSYFAERSMLDNLVTQANGVSYLIGQLFLLDRLNVDPMLPAVQASDPAALARGAMLLGFLALGIRGLRGGARWGFGVLWLFAWLAPTNSFIPRLDVANDRQLYVALAGPAWLLGLGIARVVRGGAGRGARRGSTARVLLGGALAALIAIVLARATLERNRVYADETTLWLDTTAKAPHNARAWNNLGMAHALECRRGPALSAFARAERLDPDEPRYGINRLLLERGELPGLPRRCQGTAVAQAQARAPGR